MSQKRKNQNNIYISWAKLRDISITLVCLCLLLGVSIWLISNFFGVLIILIIATLIAYVLMPLVSILEKRFPRPLAIFISYFSVVLVFSILLYIIINTATSEIVSFINNVRYLISSNKINNAIQTLPLLKTLYKEGIITSNLNKFEQNLLSQSQDVVNQLIPLFTNIFDSLFNFIVIFILSIYVLVESKDIKKGIYKVIPDNHAPKLDLLINSLNHVVRGYIRSQFILAVLIGILVGVGMQIIHIPYAFLLGILAFFLEFIPIIGVFISGVICTLIALTQGFVAAIAVLVYFVIVHIIEGDVVGPRIVGPAVGVHPAISLIAVLVGAKLFGIFGVFIASPLAGICQVLFLDLFSELKNTHITYV